MSWRSRILSALAILVLMLTALPIAGAQKPDPGGKIEPALLEKLAVTGQADFIAHFAEQADLSPAYAMGWQERGEYVYNSLKETAGRTQVAAKQYLDDRGLTYQTFIAGNELYVWSGDLLAAHSLAALPEVEYVRATRVYQIPEPAPAPDATIVWGILDTNADDFWASFGVQGDGIVVANIDTGVDYTHDALEPNYKCGSSGPHANCWLDPGTQDCTGPGGGPCDTIYFGIYHGSHTMGTMAADDDPALQYTVGMAPNAQWIACLGCPFGGCPDFDLNTCADWMLAPGGSADNRPHVVNNSWGGGGCDNWYLDKVNAWRAAGIFPAFSAGNMGSGCNSLGSPGDYQESFGSAAHDVNRDIADFSSRGPSCYGHDPYTKPNIAAPGVDVISTQPGNTWTPLGGTSMASPHSAGAVALLWSCNPSLIGQIDQTFEILQDNADPAPAGNCGAPPDNEGNYTYGYGYLNAYEAGLLWCGETGWLDGHVRDESSAPIADATVTADRLGGGTIVFETDGDGYYTGTVMVGTYDVTASKYGYLPETVTGVDVSTDTVTTVNFTLTAAEAYTVYGTVTDATTGWPLYARIDIDGYPYSPVWTDPETGYYEVVLAAGIAYDFHVSAWVSGYLAQDRAVGPLTGPQQEDFALLADADSCSAPGYQPSCFYFESFEADDGGYTTSGANSTWAWGAPTSGPGEGHSGNNAWATNLAGNYNDNEDSYVESPDIDLSALAGQGIYLSWWQWLQTEPCCDWGEVQVSNDGGASWASVYGPERGDVDLEWARHYVILDPTYAVANFRVRFHLYTDYSVVYPGFYVDDICIVPVAPPTTVYSQNFDSNNGGYSAGGTNSTWAWGAPTSGPGAAHSPPNVWATNLAGVYNTNEDSYVESPDIDLSPYAGQGVYLSWWQWLSTESCCDYGEVLVSNDGGASWATAWGPTYGGSAQWERQNTALDPSYAVANFRVRFHLWTDYSIEYDGFYVDDVAIAVGEPAQVPCVPLPGGLVVGNVYDANTVGDLTGALVANDSGRTAYAAPTPEDPQVGDAFYTLFSPPGDHTFTATMRGGYGPGIEVVTVVQSDTVGQDFFLQAGWLDTDPDNMAVTMDWGMSTTLPLTLSNLGGLPAFFDLMELDRGFQPLLDGLGTGAWLQRGAAVSQRTNRGTDFVAQPGVYRYEAKYASQLDILVCSDSCALMPPNTCPETALQNLGESYTLYYADWVGCESALGSGMYDFAFIDNSCYFPSDSTFTAIDTFINAGGRAMINSFDMDAFAGHPLWATAGVAWSSDVALSPPPPVYRWEPDHAAVSGWPSDPLQFDDNYIDDGDRIDALGSASMLAGYTAAPGGGEGAFALRNDNEVLVSSFCIDNLAYRDDDGDSVPDCAEIWQGAMGWLFAPSSDVPWLSENPVSGTVAAVDDLVVDVTFDAGVPEVTQPGDYFATLKVANDTPYGTLDVPVTMTVLPREDMGKIEGTVTDNCTAEPVEATITFPTGDPITQTIAGPDTGYYSVWMVEGTYDVVFTADGYLDINTVVSVTRGQTTTLDAILVPDRACIAVAPLSFEVWVLTGTQEIRSQTLVNNGGATLEFEYAEKPGGYTPGLAGSTVVPAPLPPVENPGSLAYAGRSSAPQGTPVTSGAVPLAWNAGSAVPGGIVRYAHAQCPGDTDSFYIFSGVDGGFSVTANSWRYDADTDTWTALAPIPMGQEGPSAVCYEDKIYVAGGGGTTQFYIYDIASDTWASGAPLPRNVWGSAMGAYEGQVFMIGGDDDFFFGGTSNVVNVYDIATDTWTGTGTPMPNAANTPGFVQLGEYVYVIGGWDDASPGANVSVSQRYDMSSDTWELGPAFTIAKADFALAATSEYLYAIGGDADGGGPFDASNSVWALDWGAWPGGTWTDISDPIPSPFAANNAGFCTDSVTGGEVWSVGGYNGAAIVGDTIYRPSEPCWTPVPLEVPWVWETPISGTVLALSSYDEEIGFTSYYTEVPTGTVVHLPLGTYTATLRIRNNDAVAGAQKVPVTMHIVAQFVAPTATFSSNAPVCLGEEVIFTNTTEPGIPPITTYAWDFGDGGTSTDFEPTHVYTAGGSYDVVLEACNEEDMCDTYTETVEVLPLTQAGFTYTADLLVVTFTNMSLNATSYLWDFGDGTTSTETHPIHVFTATGTYTVTLAAYGPCGEDSYTEVLSVSGVVIYTIYLPLMFKGYTFP